MFASILQKVAQIHISIHISDNTMRKEEMLTIARWNEYNVQVILFVLSITEIKPYSAT